MVRAFVLLVLLVAGPARAQDVASVMVVSGDAFVTDGGAEGPATVGQPLSRDDVVRTDFGGAVILHLHNNHLVRIDEDLELRVSDIVLLDAPAVELDAKAQLAQLVRPEERGSMQGLADAERVAGWHARLTAAYTPGAEDEPSADAEAERAVATRAAPGAGPSRARGAKKEPAAAPPAPPPPPRTTRSSGAAAPDASGGRADAVASSADSAGGGGAAAAKAAPVREALDEGASRSRADVEASFAKGPLHDAIVAWARALPVPVESVTFEVRVKDGRIAKIVANGGLQPPAEVRALVGTAVPDATEAFAVTVAVK